MCGKEEERRLEWLVPTGRRITKSGSRIRMVTRSRSLLNFTRPNEVGSLDCSAAQSLHVIVDFYIDHMP